MDVRGLNQKPVGIAPSYRPHGTAEPNWNQSQGKIPRSLLRLWRNAFSVEECFFPSSFPRPRFKTDQRIKTLQLSVVRETFEHYRSLCWQYLLWSSEGSERQKSGANRVGVRVQGFPCSQCVGIRIFRCPSEALLCRPPFHGSPKRTRAFLWRYRGSRNDLPKGTTRRKGKEALYIFWRLPSMQEDRLVNERVGRRGRAGMGQETT